MNVSSFSRIPWVGLSPPLYFLSQPQVYPEFALADCQLVGCGCSVISSRFPDFTYRLSSHLSDQCQGSFDWQKSLISTIPWGLCTISMPPPPLKTESSQETDKRDRNRKQLYVSLSIICCVFHAPWQADSVFTLLWGYCYNNNKCYLARVVSSAWKAAINEGPGNYSN